jgi:hypothetical protein
MASQYNENATKILIGCKNETSSSQNREVDVSEAQDLAKVNDSIYFECDSSGKDGEVVQFLQNIASGVLATIKGNQNLLSVQIDRQAVHDVSSSWPCEC